MGNTLQRLNQIRGDIAADDVALDEARERRDCVLDIADQFPGALRTYRSGSLAAGLMNRPVTDGDGGVVLDRRIYPELGPDGDGDGPYEIVEDMHDFLGPRVREYYEDATVHRMKRGLKVYFHEPIDEEQDPTVDLVIALNRKADDALWIPNRDRSRWDPSHPEKHHQLLRAGTKALRRIRARVIRLGKAWNHQYSEPGLCSFNIVALALEAITEPMPLDEAVALFFDYAGTAVEKGRTHDPADVSPPIKLLLRQAVVVTRLRKAADGLAAALEQDDDDEAVDEALSQVFFNYVKPLAGGRSELVNALRRNNYGLVAGAGPGLSFAQRGASTARPLKPTRAYGGRRGDGADR
jgi:hypothetical protein